MATFVLVHGSWHGGWCWRLLSPMLRARGHEVYTPTLTGLGASSHVLSHGVDLTTHIKDIVNLLFYEDLWNVILVGHSYAGMVITGVASEVPQRLRQLVYLDAYLPEPGQSEFDLWPPDWQAQARGDIAAGKTTREPLPPSAFGIDDPKMAEWLAARLTPQNLATYDEPTPPANPSGSALVRTYIRCTKGPFVSLTTTFAANAKRKGWEVSELATGHDVMLTMPQELADVLHKLAT